MLDAMTEARIDAQTAPPVRAIVRAERLVGRWVDSRWTVAVAAAAAFLLRLPGLTRPVRADEAGYQLVARAWNPMPDSVYGAYFVDRPPPMIALFKFSDAIGGPLFIRVLGAVACAALVLAAAAVARLVADEHARALDRGRGGRAQHQRAHRRGGGEGRAARAAGADVQPRAVAGRRSGTGPGGRRLAAGLLAGLALGFKQNLAGGVVFAAVLFVGSWRAGRLTRTELVRLAGAASAGFAVPVLGTVGWALAAGVRLHTLWYAVYGFRFDASRVLSGRRRHRPDLPGRAARPGGPRCRDAADHRRLRGAHPRRVGRRRTADRCGGASAHRRRGRSLVWAAASGATTCSRCCPVTALCAALLARRASRRGRAMRAVIAAAAVSTALCLVGWVAYNASGLQEYDEHDTGVALHDVAEPGDTLVVYGGRADLQLESGMSSPYAYLWSLPMRTLDPDLAELEAAGRRRRPADLDRRVGRPSGTGTASDGARLEQLVQEHYVRAGTACGDRPIWLLRGVDRATPQPDCHGTGFEFSSGP